MTTINLKLGCFIEMESMCYTLKQKYKGKDRKGNEKDAERAIGYFGSMRHAIERYLKEVTSDTLDGEKNGSERVCKESGSGGISCGTWTR